MLFFPFLLGLISIGKNTDGHVNKRVERGLGSPGKLLTFLIMSRADQLKKWVQIQCIP